MDKKYPRLRIQKRNGVWQLLLLKKPITSMLDQPHLMGEYMYQFDARNQASRLCGKPVRFVKTLRKH